MLQQPYKPRQNQRLNVERLEDRLAPGEVLTGVLLAPLRLLSVAELVASDGSADDVPTDGPSAVAEDQAAEQSQDTLPDDSTVSLDSQLDYSTPAKDEFLYYGACSFDSLSDSSVSSSSSSLSGLLSSSSFLAPALAPVAASVSVTAPSVSPSAPSIPTVSTDTSLASLITAAASGSDGATANVGVARPLARGPRIRPFAGGGPSGYRPNQIRHAYGFDQLIANGTDGRGMTIAIVDAYDDPNIVNDLNVFSNQFGLPTTTSGLFTFTKAYAQGSQPRADGGWAQEISLDVEWAHAIAPRANILLVEAASNSFTNLFGAVDYAVAHGAQAVSMSWGANDFNGEAAYDSHFTASNVVFVASSGDSGGVVGYPSASPYVLSVGGTHLPLDSNGNLTGTETVWSSGGGGASLYEAEPGYQTSFGLSLAGRGTPDVSYNADPYTGFAVYDSYRYLWMRGWQVFGGTSAGAPQWAALVALADQGRLAASKSMLSTNSLTTSPFYTAAGSSVYSTNYRDITSGSNGYSAGTGYDLATGLGSPLANNLVPYLVTL